MTSPVVVSPARRVAVKLPRLDTPVADSCPRDVPLTVRCVLPLASPVVVRSLVLFTVVVALTIVAVSPNNRPPTPRPSPQQARPPGPLPPRPLLLEVLSGVYVTVPVTVL